VNKIARNWMLLAAFATLALAPQAADAQMAFGIRAGISMDLDDVHIGGHVQFRDFLLPNGVLEPSATFGFGSEDVFGVDLDYTTIRVSANYKYLFGDRAGLTFYPQAGISWYRFSLSDCPSTFDCSDSEFGVNVGGGVGFGGFAIDGIIGLGNLPDLAITASYTFGIR
jgi:hypothetical protein